MKNEKGSEDFCMWKFCFIKCFRSTQRKLALLYYYLYVYVNVYMYMYMTCIRIAHSLKTPSLLCQPPHAALFLHRLLLVCFFSPPPCPFLAPSLANTLLAWAPWRFNLSDSRLLCPSRTRSSKRTHSITFQTPAYSALLSLSLSLLSLRFSHLTSFTRGTIFSSAQTLNPKP